MRLHAVTLGATLASGVAASSHHGHHHPLRRNDQSDLVHHSHMAARDGNDSYPTLKKRGKTCSLPSGEGLVTVPGASNGGWAMSPDQSCTSGTYCPYACPPGQVMAQWKPGSSYTYPSSMDGGVYCNDDGKIEKPFPSSPYCVDGTGTVKVQNKAGSPLSFCQTVLPGNEAMLIPTVISGTTTIAVPDPKYWCGTASHFYINPPGVGSEGCIWGTNSEAIGNWASFVAGANTVSNGDTYLKIGWNPEWLSSGLKSTLPSYGLEIQCDGSGCNGLPCSITPSKDGVNGVNAPSSGETADTGSFCVVTIPSGSSARIVVTGSGGSSSISSASSSDSSSDKTTKSSATSASSAAATTISSKVSKTSSSKGSESTASSSSNASTQQQSDGGGEKGAIFVEQGTTSTDATAAATGNSSVSAAEATGTYAAAAPSDTQKDEGIAHQGGAIASLVIALVVGLYLF